MNIINYEDAKLLIIGDVFITEQKLAKLERICYFCQKKFRWETSMGQLECFYHPQGYNYKTKTFLCCGREDGYEGCTRCDHNERSYFQTTELVKFLDFVSPKHKMQIYKIPLDGAVIEWNGNPDSENENPKLVKFKIADIKNTI